jgi:hypothetical protein
MFQTRKPLTKNAKMSTHNSPNSHTSALTLSCRHGETGLSHSCTSCLNDARRANYLLGQAVGMETAATILLDQAKEVFGCGFDSYAGLLRQLCSKIQILSAEKRAEINIAKAG